MIGTKVIHKPWTFPGEPKKYMFGKVVAQNGNKWLVEWDELNGACTEHTTKEVEAKHRNYERWEKANASG